jgi:hypothetical protein
MFPIWSYPRAPTILRFRSCSIGGSHGRRDVQIQFHIDIGIPISTDFRYRAIPESQRFVQSKRSLELGVGHQDYAMNVLLSRVSDAALN